jgi:hypothetical protein
LAPTPAFAGAWFVPEDGEEIWTNVAGERGDLEYFETSAYWEIPLAERTAFVATPWVEQAADSADGWRAEATFGFKRALMRGDHGAMALQAGAVWTSAPDAACGEASAELRWLGGVNFGAGKGFVNLEAAGRAGEGGCSDGRFDLTAGYKPNEHWLGMAQLFVDAPSWGEPALKAQFTLVHFSDDDRGIQIGLRARLDSDDHEPALVLGFWGKPGR